MTQTESQPQTLPLPLPLPKGDYTGFPCRILWKTFELLPEDVILRFTNREVGVDFYMVVWGDPSVFLSPLAHDFWNDPSPMVLCQALDFLVDDPLYDAFNDERHDLVIVRPHHIEEMYYVTYVSSDG